MMLYGATFLGRYFARVSPRYRSLGVEAGKLNEARHYGSTSRDESAEKIRNIAIIAHVDAGKTTFTERALYYSGYSKFMGDVDSGTSITDFHEIERRRGITVNASAISFSWNDHKVNLIDTPGHCDFSIGVDQSLRVIDGAIVIIDSNAGIEPQTEIVWAKSNAYKIPRIIFANKYDRQGHSFEKIVNLIVKGLKNFGKPIPVQYPISIGKEIGQDDISSYSRRMALVDLVKLEVLDWENDVELGSSIRRFKFSPDMLPRELSDRIIDQRMALVETLSSVSNEVVAEFLKFDGDHMKIAPQVLLKVLRSQVIAGELCPIYLGSALMNMGIQPALDGILNYLPSPLEVGNPGSGSTPGKIISPDKTQHLKANTLCAFVFKVFYDSMVNYTLFFVRIYSGSLRANTSVWNTSRGEKHTVSRLVRVYANKYENISVLNTGEIGAIVNLKNTASGDTLVCSSAKTNIHLSRAPTERGLFMLSCEPDGATTIDDIIRAMEIIKLEDPTVGVARKGEAHSLTITGLGPLHLQVLEDRLKKVHGLKCTMSNVRIAYMTTPQATLFDSSLEKIQSYAIDKEVLGKHFKAEIKICVTAHPSVTGFMDVNGQRIYKIPDNDGGNEIRLDLQDPTDTETIQPKLSGAELRSITEGIKLALSYHSDTGYPITLLSIRVIRAHAYGAASSRESSLRMAASACINTAINSLSSMQRLEPTCEAYIVIPYERFRLISSHLSSQPGVNILSEVPIEDSNSGSECMSIKAILPLRVTSTYTEPLRNLTGGRSFITTKYLGYTISE